MALLACPPRIHLLPSSSSFFRAASNRRRFSLAGARSAAPNGLSVSASDRREANDVALVWFKHDLRIDDHPGLVAASRYRTVVPVYVFDHRILSRFPDETLELVLFALEYLRKSLRDQGSDLLIEFGNAEHVILKLVKEVKATHIFAEEEVEYDLCTIISIVQESLSCVPFPWGSPQLVFWKTAFYDIKDLKELPESYCDFQKFKFPLTTPLASPALPGLDITCDRGTLPAFDDVKRYMDGNPSKLEESWTSIKAISPKTILWKDSICQVKMPGVQVEGSEESNSGKSNQASKNMQRKRLEKSVFISRSGNLVGGGTDVVLNALAAYLRYLEGTARDDWQEVHEKLRNAESRKGASFGALFGCALYLGIISRRRVHYEAIKYERERNAGFLSPFGYSAATVAAAVDGVNSMEWYWLLALKCQTKNEGRYSPRIWRWKGYLIQYTVVGHQGPAVLLVHGFGAFLEHYRDNISGIADDGNQVWAITLLGFGKSEKPNIIYTELVWAELLRDFIVDVVGEPVHLIGNSIGGYFVALVAGLWPALVKSVVLINTAGSVIPGYSSVQLAEGSQTSGIAWLGAQILLLYLRSRARSILKNCYPTNADRVDDWLVNKILRASYDPGVLVVLECVFGFNLSIPLNYLLDTFGGKVLVIQGMKDPLSKSNLKLSLLKEHCSSVMIRELDAGHCPHDEWPEKVNSIICEWTRKTESSLQAVETI
ncbi:6-4DNA photolyase [Cinnamomum micranthum f. kanehirae]|uniref:6-4DNA photolyase n=1 Tax=Cinnamomum micranthum f. kanehirae TaxID=337451 RepID=A0A3S3N3C4_9MAGN|nr:6-4DNA photolyase [Cinnamomum micranthum f. kanehirae]